VWFGLGYFYAGQTVKRLKIAVSRLSFFRHFD